MTHTEFLDWRRTPGVNNIIDLLISGVKSHPDQLLAVQGDTSLTYVEALEAARGFARLHAETVESRVVVLAMQNSALALITYLSVLYSGGVPTLLNSNTPAKAAAALLADIKPALIVTDDTSEIAQYEQTSTFTSAAIHEWINEDRVAHDPIESKCPSGSAAGTYLCTGGTTGVPKRVCYSHEQILAAGERMQWGWPMRAGEVFLPIAPFSHIYGFLMGICVPLQTGGSSVILDKFHPKSVLDAIENQKVSVLGGGPPAIYQALLAQEDLELRDLSSLRCCPGGGAPFPVAVLEEWKARTDLDIFEGYGMTEVAPIAVNTKELGKKAGAAGKPVPNLDIRIVSLDDEAHELEVGVAGEICVRAPHLMTEYVGAPDETAKVMTGGWMKTGDVGIIDEDGFLVITDRKKDVILHKGFNVFPREVEETLLAHPNVAAACVVGAPDERHGERVVAFVCMRNGASTSDDALIEHCKDYLVSYRLPGQIQRLKEMPLTSAGKLNRIALREAARANNQTKIAS